MNFDPKNLPLVRVGQGDYAQDLMPDGTVIRHWLVRQLRERIADDLGYPSDELVKKSLQRVMRGGK